MGMSTWCCRNPLPQSPALDHRTSSPSLPTRASLVPRKNESTSWRNKCVVGMACTIIIGVEMGDFVSNTSGSNSMASELTMESQLLPNNNINNNRAARWSDKRSCPAWNLNSLETIVPENLPRPSTQRKWEGISYSPTLAPPVKFTIKSRTNCFSM